MRELSHPRRGERVRTVGPDLDQVLKGKDAAFIHESIVDPDAEVASGFTAGVMPAVYADQLDDQQLADLVAFLEQSCKRLNG